MGTGADSGEECAKILNLPSQTSGQKLGAVESDVEGSEFQPLDVLLADQLCKETKIQVIQLSSQTKQVNLVLDGAVESSDAHFGIQVHRHAVLILDQKGLTVEFDLGTGLDVQNG